jgi:hypothetical protein
VAGDGPVGVVADCETQQIVARPATAAEQALHADAAQVAEDRAAEDARRAGLQAVVQARAADDPALAALAELAGILPAVQ